MKRFNTTGTCRSNEHYMVDITERLEIICKMVAQGDYFCINRGRQYGKTTTLEAVQHTLENFGYTVFFLSFEGMSEGAFLSLNTLLFKLVQKFNDCILWDEVKCVSESTKLLLNDLERNSDSSIDDVLFSRTMTQVCKTDKVVLLIDEVDQASNSVSFIQFLGLLREMFLRRDKRPTFQSVILAGVYDIKNLKLKVRSDEKHQHNSPWNIAAPFNVDMSLSAAGIKGMLDEYEADHHKGIDTEEVASWVSDYTGGYPFLVSRLCQLMDERDDWSHEGLLDAVKVILNERNTLFDDMIKKIEQFPDLKSLLKDQLFSGESRKYNPDNQAFQLAEQFNIIRAHNGSFEIACRIIETRIYEYFMAEEHESEIYTVGSIEKPQFIKGTELDMPLLLQK